MYIIKTLCRWKSTKNCWLLYRPRCICPRPMWTYFYPRLLVKSLYSSSALYCLVHFSLLSSSPDWMSSSGYKVDVSVRNARSNITSYQSKNLRTWRLTSQRLWLSRVVSPVTVSSHMASYCQGQSRSQRLFLSHYFWQTLQFPYSSTWPCRIKAFR